MVVSLTNFQLLTTWIFTSLISSRNSHGPNLEHCRTPEGISPHSEKQLCESLTRCFRFVRISATKRAMLRGIFRLKIFCTRIWWSIRSNFFCSQIRPLYITEAPVLSVEIRACAVEDFGLASNWLESITSRTADATYDFTTNSSATLDIAGVREMGLRWLLTSSTGLFFLVLG